MSPALPLQGCVLTYSSRAKTGLSVPFWSPKARQILELGRQTWSPTHDSETGKLSLSPWSAQCLGHLEQLLSLSSIT